MHNYNEYIKERTEKCIKSSEFDPSLYTEFDVKKGLRDSNGKGVVAGLTNISKVTGSKNDNGKSVPCKGVLLYRGYDIKDLVRNRGKKLGLFEQCAHLLLFNELPDEEKLNKFHDFLNSQIYLPPEFVKDTIMNTNGHDVMNSLSRGVLGLGLYDEDMNEMSPENALSNCLRIISTLPAIAVYSHNALAHYFDGESFHIVRPLKELTVPENILRLMHPEGKYTELEALVLDRILTLHMEHGGGNNSAFTARVVSSSGADTYSVIAAAMLSLKGPKHGGANLKVHQMAQDIMAHVEDITDKTQMREYLTKIVNKEAFDGTGLVYGMGHAVYTESDPRSDVLKMIVEELAREKGRMDELRMYNLIEELAPGIIRNKHDAGPICANIDLYSGFAYDLLGIPEDLYTPMFAVARSVGWCAHHLEEIISSNKIIRPAYVSVVKKKNLD